MSEQPGVSHVVAFGHFEADLRTEELRKGGLPVRLSAQSFQVLRLLLLRPGELVSRQELQRALWPNDSFGDFEHGLNAAVNRLRDALGDAAENPRFIETLPRRGYRFIAPIEPREETSAGPVTFTDRHTEKGPGRQLLPDAVDTRGAKGVSGRRIEPKSAEASAAEVRNGQRKMRIGILACLLALIIVAAAWFLQTRVKAVKPIRSIAVLPLENLSSDPNQEYFADGMTDELITELARIPGLRVVSRTSVMQDKGTRKSLAQIARELNVDAIVEGSVVRSGNRVRITAQLIDARSDKHLWAQSFEEPLGDILSLQDDIAREISLQTSTVLAPAVQAGLTNTKHVNPEAYDDYLRGLYFIRRRDGDLAVSYFRKAVSLEPEYAAANAGLAEALVTQSLVDGPHVSEIMPSAIAAAKRAIELDPYSGEAYTALGAIDTNYLLDWNAAEHNLRRGIELSPSSSDAETWFAVYLTSVGRPAEAVDAMRRAVALDPLSFWANRLLGSMLYYSRHYDESLVALKRASELAPDKFSFVEGWNSGNYEMQGRHSDAFAADMKELASELSPQDVSSFRSAFETGGWKGYQEARVKYLLSRPMKYDTNDLAMSYVRLGNITEAVRWFNRDLDNCCGRTVFDLSSDPRLDKIREDPRFTTLLHRANLPH